MLWRIISYFSQAGESHGSFRLDNLDGSILKTSSHTQTAVGACSCLPKCPFISKSETENYCDSFFFFIPITNWWWSFLTLEILWLLHIHLSQEHCFSSNTPTPFASSKNDPNPWGWLPRDQSSYIPTSTMSFSPLEMGGGSQNTAILVPPTYWSMFPELSIFNQVA